MGGIISRRKKKAPALEEDTLSAVETAPGKGSNTSIQPPTDRKTSDAVTPAKNASRVPSREASPESLDNKFDESSVTAFLLAFKAAQSDGWKKLVSNETVSVHQNTTSKVPFPTTLVRCQFQCPMSASEALAHLADLSLRNERDFFFKGGQVEKGSEKQNRKVFNSTMRLINRSELQLKVVQISREQDKGSFVLVETPEDSEISAMLYPSFFIQSLGGGSSSVVALYQFDVKKAWPEMSKALEKDLSAKLLDLFSEEVAQPLGLSLIGLGSQRETNPEPAPTIVTSQPAPPAQPTPPPPQNAVQLHNPSGGGGEGAGEKDLIVGSKYKWKKGELIGHGAIGKVYMGLNFETGEMMAVKQVDLGQQLGPQAAEELKAMDQEIHIFSLISHPNLVRYYGMEKTPNQVLIFLEYVSGGSIASMLRKFGAFSEHMISNFTAQIVDGLEYLHSQAICHRDIKAANILYSNEGVVKLADFGTAKKIADVMNNSTGLKSLVGTPYMMAPEVIRQTGHGMPADIWSLACVIWEMATTKPPFTQFTDRIVAMYNIAHAKAPPDPPDSLSPDAKSFVRACMTIQAGERATTKQLLEHAFIKAVPRKATDALPAAPLPKLPARPEPDDRVVGKDKEMPAIGEEEEGEWGSQSDLTRSRAGGSKSPAARTPQASPTGKPAYSPAQAKDSGGSAHRQGRDKETPKSKPRRWAAAAEEEEEEEEEDEQVEEKARRARSKSRSKSPEPARAEATPTRKGGGGGGGKHRHRPRAGEVEVSDSSDEDEEGGRVQAALAAKKKNLKGGGTGKKGPGAEDSELSEEGLTREQCRELGKPFRPAKPLFGYRLGSREERSDSESESDEEAPARGGRTHAPTRHRHHHHAPKTKSATYDDDTESGSD